MRPITKNGEEVGAANLMRKLTGYNDSIPWPVNHMEEVWDEWHLHCLVLVSFFLQVFLFLTAGMRTRSASRVLRSLLWLAYVSADFLADYALGNLAVHASGGRRRHSLMLLWAPFLLLHLGGQENITAFSREDNVLWKRHLLNLVTQVAVAAYVVSMSSWPDRRLLAAMVLVFLCGCLKYAERTYCFYFGRPANLRDFFLGSLSKESDPMDWKREAKQQMEQRFRSMLKGGRRSGEVEGIRYVMVQVMAVDTPLNDEQCILAADDLPPMIMDFSSSPDRLRAYEFVGADLLLAHKLLYTKHLLHVVVCSTLESFQLGFRPLFFLLLLIVHYMFTPIALVLFMIAEWGNHLHHSTADIVVSYILLVGALVLDIASASMYIFPKLISKLPEGRTESADSPQVKTIQLVRKQFWSKELAQYSVIKKYAMQCGAGMSSKCIGGSLNACGFQFFNSGTTHTSITEDLKELVLDKLLEFGRQQERKFTSSRGQLALDNWNHTRSPKLQLSMGRGVDLPTTVLIWHIATDMCFYSSDSSSSSNTTQINKMRNNSRVLSNYIMYLAFKCCVMLTSNCQRMHRKAHHEIREILFGQKAQQVNLCEREVVMKLFEAKKEEQGALIVNEKQKHKEPIDKDKELLQITVGALYNPVLPLARRTASELMKINDQTALWKLISEIWLEMLYYIAPRCGGAFHYEHLGTNGEFITHVLLLMHLLGPFLPIPPASVS